MVTHQFRESRMGQYRVIQWATGVVGTAALKGLIRHPALELAGVKVYSLFRLSKQRWFNRGDQKSATSGDWLINVAREGIAGFQTAVMVTLLFLIVIFMSGLVEMPGTNLFYFISNGV